MHRPAVVEVDLTEEMASRLHEICQPLTALQCGLELGLMDRTPDEMRVAMEDALKECARMNMRVHAMQFALRGVRR